MKIDFGTRPACLRNSAHEIAFVSVIACAQLLTQAALGNVLVPLHIIGDDMNMTDPAKLPWTLSAYSLTVGIFILVTGRLGDIYGHKLLVIVGFVIFSVFSAFVGLGAYVKNDVYFNIMRAFQGIGPATLLPNAVALLARAYPAGKRKSLAFAMFGAAAPSGFVLGALFGSIFAQLLWWPWAQWVLAFFCAFLAVVACLIVPEELSPPVNPEGKPDVLGAVFGLSGLTLFIYCWNEGPVVGWDKPYVYALLIVSVAVIGVFILIEAKVKEPIMPLCIWTVKGFPGVLACVALGWSSFGIYIYYIIQFLQVLRGASPLLTTALLSPVVIFGLIATLSVSQLYGRVPAHFLLMGSLVFFCVINILVGTMPVEQTYWAQVFVSTIVAPFAMDVSFPSASLIVSNTMPAHQQGVAASMVNLAINWSISLGLGIAGTVESELLKRGHSTLEGYRGGSYVGIGLSGFGILIALLFCRVPAASPSPVQEKRAETKALESAEAYFITNTDMTQNKASKGDISMEFRV